MGPADREKTELHLSQESTETNRKHTCLFEYFLLLKQNKKGNVVGAERQFKKINSKSGDLDTTVRSFYLRMSCLLERWYLLTEKPRTHQFFRQQVPSTIKENSVF